MNRLNLEHVSKNYGTKELFTDVTFGLSSGDRVGLIGVNGTGKSTLLKIAAGLVEPDEGQVVRSRDLTVSYLAQVPDFRDVKTPLEAVLSGHESSRSAGEAGQAENLPSGSSAAASGQACGSGAAAGMNSGSGAAAGMSGGSGAAAGDAGRNGAVSEKTGGAGAAAEKTDGADAGEIAQAKAMLNRLGITDHEADIQTLSGGQRKRVALARTLLSGAELLILDEPTNHLDQGMILWLEDYIRRFSGELLLITHDRYFLDHVTNRIAELDRGTLYTYEAGYEKFLQLKAEREEMEAATENKRQNLLRTELQWIMRGARARSTKQQARIQRFDDLRQASREARERMETSSLQMSSVSTRLGKKTIELSGVTKRFGERIVVDHFSYIFLRDDRIGFIGPNGCGKSTLMNLIAGDLQPDEGTVSVGDTVKIGYFRQESDLEDLSQTVIGYVKGIGEYVRTADGLITASQMCEKFLFDKKMQWAKIGNLSGGERRRLQLLSVLMSAPNVLILDEPTNDLDIETLEILEDYLDHFQGIIITVSHDRYFLDRVVSRIFAFEDGTIRPYEGGFTDYADKKLAAGEELFVHGEDEAEGIVDSRRAAGQSGKSARAVGEAASGTPLTGREAYEAQKAENAKNRRKKMTYREQKEYESIDGEMETLQQKLDQLDAQIAESATDYAKLQELSEERQRTAEELDKKEERWLELSELAEEIAKQE